MSTALEESPVTQLIQTLWKGRSHGMEDVNIGVRMPHTVVYEHNFPKGLFSTTSGGSLQRRSGKEIDSKMVVDVLSTRESHPPGGSKSATKVGKGTIGGPSRGRGAGHEPHHVVASYIERKAEAEEFSVQFLTEEGLKRFLLGAVRSDNRPGGTGGSAQQAPSGQQGAGGAGNSNGEDEVTLIGNKNGLLQQFTYPIGDHSEQIQVLWTPHMCLAEKVRNTNASLWDGTKTPFERAATFQGPPSFVARAYVAPQVTEAIRKHCEGLAAQIYLVEHRPVEEMTLYFATDEFERLWFLWCPFLRLSTMPMDRRAIEDQGGLQRYAHHAYRNSHNLSRDSSNILPEYKIPLKYIRSAAGAAGRLGNKSGSGNSTAGFGAGNGEITMVGSSGGDGDASGMDGSGEDGGWHRVMRITMGASFVTISEEALLSDDPAATQARIDRKRREKEAQAEAQGGGTKSNRSSLLASVTQSSPSPAGAGGAGRPATANSNNNGANSNGSSASGPSVVFKYPSMNSGSSKKPAKSHAYHETDGSLHVYSGEEEGSSDRGGGGGQTPCGELTMLSGGAVPKTEHNDVTLATKSRLCPKMRWLGRRGLGLERPRSSLNSSSAKRTGSSLYNRTRNPAENRGGGASSSNTTPQPTRANTSMGGPLGDVSPIQQEPHETSHRGGDSLATSALGGGRSTPASTTYSNTSPRPHHGGPGNVSFRGDGAAPAGGTTMPSDQLVKIVFKLDTPNPLPPPESAYINGGSGTSTAVNYVPAVNHTASDLLLPKKKKEETEKQVGRPGREADILRDLADLPLDRRLYPKDIDPAFESSSPMDFPYVTRMKKAKNSLRYAADYLDELRDTMLSHFLVNSHLPLAFSIPTFLLNHQEVSTTIIQIIAENFKKISSDEAIELDMACDRVGTIDELSHHHTYPPLQKEAQRDDEKPKIDIVDEMKKEEGPPRTSFKPTHGTLGGKLGQQRDGINKSKNGEPQQQQQQQREELPCFICSNQAQFRSFKARLPVILLVTLRNTHAEIEQRLLRHALSAQSSTESGGAAASGSHRHPPVSPLPPYQSRGSGGGGGTVYKSRARSSSLARKELLV